MELAEALERLRTEGPSPEAVETVALAKVDDVVVRTKVGTLFRVHPQSDYIVSRAFLTDGIYEEAQTAFLRHVLRPGDRFVDVGANIGCHAVTAAWLGASVIAIEPSPVLMQRLKANLALNGLSAECVQK